MDSLCFPRIPIEITSRQIARMFEGVQCVDLVPMEDETGFYQMAFVHFIHPNHSLIEHAHTHELYIGGWLVKPNYKPIKRSLRKWTMRELIDYELLLKTD
jgi:hypothetical protein